MVTAFYHHFFLIVLPGKLSGRKFLLWIVFLVVSRLRMPCGVMSESTLWVPFCRRKARLSLYLTLTWPTVLTGDGAGSGMVIHVGTAGGLVGHAHFRQVFPNCSDHIPRIGFGMSDVADIPKPLVGKGLSSLTMNRSNLILAAIPVRTHLAHCKRHVGIVGIASMLCHHLISSLLVLTSFRNACRFHV